MNIFYSSSDEFAPYLGVSLFSVLVNNRSVAEINVYIMDMGIRDERKKRLTDMCRALKRRVYIIPVADRLAQMAEEKGLPMFNGSYAPYAKLFACELIPDVDKAMIIDSDTVVDGSLFELYNKNISGVYGAAVPELTAWIASSEDPDIIYKNKYYFNCGMLLLNLKKMREERFLDKVMDELDKYGKEVKLVDQSLFNLTVTTEDIIPVHFKYNYLFHAQSGSNRRKAYRYYKKNGWKFQKKSATKKDIRIYHFIGRRKPWTKWRLCPYAKIWCNYWRRSPFRDFPRGNLLVSTIKAKKRDNRFTYAAIPVLGKMIVASNLLCARYTPGLWKVLCAIKGVFVRKKENVEP